MAPTQAAGSAPRVLTGDADFSYTVFGWTITEPPPNVTAAGNFAPSPTAPVSVGTTSMQVVPTQTVTPSSLGKAGTNSLTFLSTSGGTNPGYWELGSETAQSAVFNLELATPVSIDLSIVVAAMVGSQGNADGGYNVWINGDWIVNTGDTNTNWHEVSIPVDASKLVAGNNTITIGGTGTTAEWLQSVTVGSGNVPLAASFYWQQIGAGQLYPGDSFNRTLSVTNGNTSTDTETTTFGTTIGVSVSAKGPLEMLEISAQLTASFSYSTSEQHSIAISEQTTSSYGVNLTPPAGAGSLTFQVWQLCIQYQASDEVLTQALGPDSGPIIVRQFAG